MDKYGTLKFDEMVVDTNLAKEYFEKNKYMFEGFEIVNSVEVEYSSHNKKLTYKNAAYDDINKNLVCYHNMPVKLDELKSLADRIEENSELFCQLEFLRTGTPIEEVKNFDLNLIVEHLRYPIQNTVFAYQYLVLDKFMPLWLLGNIATFSAECKILCDKESAMIAHLFFALCCEVGFIGLGLKIVKEIPKLTYGNRYSESRDGCSTIVTEHADIDSAIDSLLLSTDQEHYPWARKRVLVQESIYEAFQNKLAGKTTEKPSEGELKLATKVYAWESKTFIIDYVGNTTPERHISVQAYRTNKELLAMLKEFESLFSVVWSQDISEANEIAFKAKANFVWINDDVSFKHPMAIDALYFTFRNKCHKSIKDPAKMSKLLAAHRAWLSYSVEKRRRIITDAVNASMDKYENAESISDIIKAGLDNYNGNFVEVSNGSMCIGISKPTELPCCSVLPIRFDTDFVFLLKSVIVGNALVLIKRTQTLNVCSEILEAAGVPIIVLNSDEPGDYHINVFDGIEKKVVWSNYGTIFAN